MRRGADMPFRKIRLPDVPMGTVIPKMIHQHCFPGEAALPDRLRVARHALRAANPDWGYRLWDTAAAEAFISEIYGESVLRRFRRVASISTSSPRATGRSMRRSFATTGSS